MGRLPPLLIGLLLLALLAFLCIGRGAPAIQADVLACAEATLAGGGFGDVSAAVDGRDVTLRGREADDDTRARARTAVVDDCGARVVIDQKEPGENELGGGPVLSRGSAIAPTGPYRTSICIEPGRVDITGSVPDPELRGIFLASVEERIGDVSIASDLGIRPGAPPGYPRLMQRAFVELSQLEEGCITLEGDQLRVSGAVRSQEARDRLVGDLEEAAQDDFRLTFDLDVPELSASAQACQALYNERLAPGAAVLFDFDSTVLHDEGRALLQEVAQIAERCPGTSIIVAGHTDGVGEASYNRILSQRRAEAVVDYLIGLGFARERLTAMGYGESQPKASNETEEGRAMNRRIEFRVRETR